MQPDDLARRILDRGFLTSKEVQEAAGAPPPARPAVPARRRPPTWSLFVVGVAAVASVLTGVFLALSVGRDTGAPPQPAARPVEGVSGRTEPAVWYGGLPKLRRDQERWFREAEARLAEDPNDVNALRVRAEGLQRRVSEMSEGHDRDIADEEARSAAAKYFQADPGSFFAANTLWGAHGPIRSKLAALGPPALSQRVQALATLREAMMQTLARNPTGEPNVECKHLVAAASLELGDAVSLAGQRAKALELWHEAASLDASLAAEVERRKAGR